MAITSYQSKESKSVNILSTLHPSVSIPEEKNPKKKPESVLFYNKTKFGVNVIDQMTRSYSVKAARRRWPILVFNNIIDLALTKSWIVYKNVCKSSISRRKYVQKISEELNGNVPNSTQTEKKQIFYLHPLNVAEPARPDNAKTEQQMFATIVSNLLAENVRKNVVDCACHKNVCC